MADWSRWDLQRSPLSYYPLHSSGSFLNTVRGPTRNISMIEPWVGQGMC
jgi:hypothetical protein